MNQTPKSLSVVIPTYQRGEVLLDTLDQLQQQDELADEIIVVDQTKYEETEYTFKELQKQNQKGAIKWLRLDKPSIPIAMNVGLQNANSKLVLFLDDDVVLTKGLVQYHKRAFIDENIVATVGQILQPEQSVVSLGRYQSQSGLTQDLNFPFNADHTAVIHNCMAGNLCVEKKEAVLAGAFDERFYSIAYRFETDFCRRLIKSSGKKFVFLPEASLDHLKSPRGGTRADHANFLVSAAPHHSYGDYYFAMKHGSFFSAIYYIVRRFVTAFCSRFYLTRPWWLPVRFVGEVRGFFQALWLRFKGPLYINKRLAEK